jgi:predicted ester cyclase
LGTDERTIEANRLLGHRFFQEQDRLRGGPAETLCDPAYVARLGGGPDMSRSEHEQFAGGFYSAFSDMRHEVEEVFASEDRIAVRFVLHGTHDGTFFGIPSTGRSIRVTANVLMHVSSGRISRLMGVFDEAGLLRQLGVLNP